MAKIIHFHNPLDKSDNTGYLTDLNTFGQWVEDKDILRNSPTVVILNGAELLEEDFDTHLNDDDVVCLVSMPEADPATWALIGSFFVDYGVYIVAAVAALTLPGMLEPDLPTGTTPDEGSSNYSVRTNRARLGKPIPVLYGTMRTYPDLSAASYFEFYNDDQVVYQLFELTQGYAEVDEASAQFEDTLLSNFQDYEIETIHPGEVSTIFPTNVIVSTEVTGLEMLDVELGPYTVNEASTQVSHIGWDLSAPQGLYRLTDHGSFRVVTVWFELWAREIDDSGVAVGSWVNYGSHSMSNRSRDPRNRTYKKAVPLGRYEAKVVRTTLKNDDSNYIDSMQWVGLKGYFPNSDVTDTTRIAVKIRASEQLGNYVLSKFNVKATRRIRSWTTAGGWAAEAASNSIAWAFADACSKSYGGNRDDAYIDLPALEALDILLTADGLECNGVFDTKSDLWSALQNIAQTGFCNRIDRAGVYTLIQDSAQVPEAMFGHRNIVKDSFSITHTGVVEESADSVKVEFNDAAQNYRPTSQLCIFDGGTSDNPRIVKLWGVTDQTQAHRIGMWLLAQSTFRRETISFETGIEGKIPTFGSQIAVSHYLIGQAENEPIVSGEVTAFDSIDVLTLSEGVTGLTDPYIVLRNKDGSPTDALQCTILTDTTVRVLDAFDNTLLSFAGNFERTHFTMGSGTTFTALVKVVSVETTGKGKIKITGFVDDPSVYDAASGLAVPDLPETTDPVDLAPVISNLVATASGTVADTIVTLSWEGTNSDKYDVEYSLDAGTTWQDADGGFTLTTGFEHHLDTPPSAVHYRVAGVSLARGMWATVIVDTTLTTMLPPTVTGLALDSAFTGTSFTVSWDTQPDANWRVEIYDGVTRYSEDVTTNTITLGYETLVPLGVGRSFDVRVTPINYEGLEAAYTSLSISNPQSAAITGITTIGTTGVIGIEWTPSNETDHKGVAIWMSTSAAFTADDTTLLTKDAGNKHYSVAIDDTAPRYFRIAAYDVWGFDSLNLASEFSSSTTSGASFKSASGYIYYQTRQTSAPSTPTVGSLFTLSASSPYNFETGVLTTTGSSWEQTPLAVDTSQSNYYYMTFAVSQEGSADQVVTLGSVLLGTQFQNLVTFTSLSTPGITTIDGGNIKTGTITIGGAVSATVGGTSLNATNTLNTNTTADDVELGNVDNTSDAELLNGSQGNFTGNVTGQLNGTTASTVVNYALDPAARINAVSTTIDGPKITTGTITANEINTASIQADVVTAASVSAVDITGNTITGSLFRTSASSSTSRVEIYASNLPTVSCYTSSTKTSEMGGTSWGSVYGLSYSTKPGMYARSQTGTEAMVVANTGSGAGLTATAVSAEALHGISTNDYGVRGGSTNSDGVYGTTSGSNDAGVRGYTTGDGYGGYFETDGNTNSEGVYAKNPSSAGNTPAGYFDSGSCDVLVAVQEWACYSIGASETGGVSSSAYGPFTGAHDALISPTQADRAELGDIVVDKFVVAKAGVSDAITRVSLCNAPNQKAAVGVVSNIPKPLKDCMLPSAMTETVEMVDVASEGSGRGSRRKKRLSAKYDEIKDTTYHVMMNSLGEGQVNVCGENGDIEVGDLITTSSRPGKGMLQSDDLVHNYTVAKAREAVTFTGNEVKMIACIYLCG